MTSLCTLLGREFCRTWPNQREIAVKGSHFIQEDSPDEIGRAIADWYMDAGVGGVGSGWLQPLSIVGRGDAPIQMTAVSEHQSSHLGS